MSLAADTLAALHGVQLEIGTRYAANPAPDSTADHPPMILITDPTADDERLRALAVLGHDLNIHIVINGAWTTGTTWRIDEHGYATDGQTYLGRLNILSQPALTELSQILQPAPPSPGAD